MKRLIIVLAVLGFVVGGSDLAVAADNDAQSVGYSVSAINELAVSGDPSALAITTAVAGSAPTDATNSSTTYGVTTNQTGAKITGAINTAMPSGTTLTVNLTAPTGGTSLGAVTLGTAAGDLVTGITQVAEDSKTIAYIFSATPAAGVISSASKTVTLTLTGGA